MLTCVLWLPLLVVLLRLGRVVVVVLPLAVVLSLLLGLMLRLPLVLRSVPRGTRKPLGGAAVLAELFRWRSDHLADEVRQFVAGRCAAERVDVAGELQV